MIDIILYRRVRGAVEVLVPKRRSQHPGQSKVTVSIPHTAPGDQVPGRSVVQKAERLYIPFRGLFGERGMVIKMNDAPVYYRLLQEGKTLRRKLGIGCGGPAQYGHVVGEAIHMRFVGRTQHSLDLE